MAIPTPLQKHYLDAMGIQVWQEKQSVINDQTAFSPEINLPRESWEFLKKGTLQCQACHLSKTRQNVVFGSGNPQADLMIIGEAPGAQEDSQGLPFVGRAGQLLTNMLQAIGLTRDKVFIANVLKCRPPNNRDPQPEEVAQCTSILTKQIELIEPKLILALGRISAHYLLQTDQALARMRERDHVYQATQTPLMVTYHPAYLLRSPQDKKKSLEDLLKVKAKLHSATSIQ